MFDINDPTRELVSAPKLPMTPAQLDALRPKPATATPLSDAAEAKKLAYDSGIKELEGLVLRVQALERQVAELRNK